MTIEEIRDMPITDFLHKLGLKPTKRRCSEVWYHAPYRSDRTPSFCVNTDKNIFNDFGAGVGGDIFELAGLMIPSNDFMAQVKYITEMASSPLEKSEPPRFEPLPTVPQFTDVEVMPLRNYALLNYLQERGIPIEISTDQCVEVHYKLHGKQYFAVGFPNEDGGYEIRNKFFKGSIPPKAVSVVKNGSPVVNVYEGFMDYLSGLTLGYGKTEDNLVLNSVSNTAKAYKHLDRYDQINTWLDNDEAGRKCLDVLRNRYGEKVTDHSEIYRSCKDVNEYLQTKKKEQQTRKTKLKL